MREGFLLVHDQSAGGCLVLDRHGVRVDGFFAGDALESGEDAAVVVLVALHGEAALLISVLPGEAATRQIVVLSVVTIISQPGERDVTRVSRAPLRKSHMTTNTLTALITGGTSGIGRATANKLAQLGFHVVVVGRNAERGTKTVDAIRAMGGEADFISSELRDGPSARAVAKRALELGNGHVDVLINNAGIYPFGPTHEMTEEQFDSVYSLNVKAPYFLVAELAPLMAQKGKGAIVNLSTMAADYGAPGMSLYGSSKAAINLLTKTWAAEYGPRGVRVNAVSPGPTRTEGTEAMGEGVEQLASQAPAGRPATADEIAEAIVFLATDRASFIYGAKLAVDGGRTAI